MDSVNKRELLENERELADQNNLTGDESRWLAVHNMAFQRAALYWEKEVAKVEKNKAILWRRFSLFTGALAFLAVGAVFGLTPLKEVVPYMTLVDKHTGNATVVGVGGKHVSSEFARDMYWLGMYVTVREGYAYASQDASYELVKEFTDASIFGEYHNFTFSSKGYLQQLGKKRFVRTVVDNLIPVPNKNGLTAQAWFTKTVVDDNGVAVPELAPVSWQALITYKYVAPSKNLQKYMLNPTGFKVTGYERFEQIGGTK